MRLAGDIMVLSHISNFLIEVVDNVLVESYQGPHLHANVCPRLLLICRDVMRSFSLSGSDIFMQRDSTF